MALPSFPALHRLRWADELKKFAPGLVVHTYYASSKNKSKAIEALRDADVLITTPHMNIGEAFLARVRLHRLVLDEAHLLNPGSTTAQKLGSLMRYQAKYAWCVTGTPFSTSLRQLLPQAKLLGQDEAGICVNDFVNGRKRAGWVPPSSGSVWKNHWPRDTVKNDEVTALLRKAMIRHTKAMRIGGAVALALPDADVQTLWLDMSDDERRLYRLHGCADGGQYMLQEDHQRLKACSHLYAPEVVCGSSSSFRWQQRGAGSSGGPSKQLSQAEREALSLASPAPYGQHAEATATFLRLHTHSVEAAPKLGARERRMQRMRAASKTGAGGEADEDAEGLPATVDVYTPNANLTKFRALLAELTELHSGPWTHPSPVSCLLPPAPSCPPAAPKGGEAAPTHRRGVVAAPYSRRGLPRAPRRDAAYRPRAPLPLSKTPGTRPARAPAVGPPAGDPPPSLGSWVHQVQGGAGDARGHLHAARPHPEAPRAGRQRRHARQRLPGAARQRWRQGQGDREGAPLRVQRGDAADQAPPAHPRLPGAGRGRAPLHCHLRHRGRRHHAHRRQPRLPHGAHARSGAGAAGGGAHPPPRADAGRLHPPLRRTPHGARTQDQPPGSTPGRAGLPSHALGPCLASSGSSATASRRR